MPDGMLADTKVGVRDYVNRVLLSGKAVEDDENLLLSGLIDSLGVMSLISHLEKTCGVVIPLDDVTVENFVSIDAISAYVSQKRAG